MKLQERISVLVDIGQYMISQDVVWNERQEEAFQKNNWFSREFQQIAIHNLSEQFLQKDKLIQWAESYHIPEENNEPKLVGLIMAGNIPLVGFHDFLSVFISGHRQQIKLSSKDDVLLKHLVNVMTGFNPAVEEFVTFSDMLKGCDAYIATGSDNSSRYFEYYFSKYPHFIRRNRTSVAILTGNETDAELEKLADDVHLFFGLGCRNVTKLYVPKEYNFEKLLQAFNKYVLFINHSKYKNNYDYNLALHILSKRFYMTNGHLLLIEDKPLFSPISQLNYEYYDDAEQLKEQIAANEQVQCIVGRYGIEFGKAQKPGLMDYADGIDTMKFLTNL
jgi:hypothetical protein